MGSSGCKPNTAYLTKTRKKPTLNPSSSFFSSSSQVYTWGHNRVGQLGYTNSEAVPRNHEGAFFLPKPRVVESLRGLRVRKVCTSVSQFSQLSPSSDCCCGSHVSALL